MAGSKKKSSLYTKYIFLYFLSYAPMGAVFPLIGQYLDSIGLTGTQIGTVTGAATFVGIFATGIWGGVFNSSSKGALVVMFLCLASGAVATVLPLTTSFLVIVALYSAFLFFQQPINALSDAMVMEDGERFNTIRMWGAIAYAVTVFLAGKLADTAGLVVIFNIALVAFVAAAISLWFIHRDPSRSERAGEGGSAEGPKPVRRSKNIEGYKALLKDPTYRRILAVAFFVGGTNIANNTYFGFLYREAGGDLTGLGLTMLLMVGSEAPFMFLSAKLSEKFTLERMILVSIIIAVIRFTWYGTLPSTTMITALFFLQGMVNGIILVEFIKYVTKISDQENIGLAVSTYYVVSSNISSIICQLLGGIMLDFAGARGVYFLFGAMNFVGAVLYTAFKLHVQKAETK